ncbi:MAG: methionyl-tRNA formyltransferase [Clostridia bacterium]|nr:methionyl-tRNA formyltransferase [Clostridia bacterium]
MNVVFMGTPDFAVPSLQILLENNYNVTSVFTQPDKPKGRGHKMQFSPVKELALKYDIPVFQPDRLKNDEIIAEIKSQCPDFIVVVAYGKLLPEAILNIPRFGCINVHGSLLPKYRGAAPIQWAVLNGEKTTGVTTMYMAKGMDTGDMLLKAETEIPVDETSGELFDRLTGIGADLLLETLKGLEAGTVKAEPQNEAEATHSPMITRELSPIDWNKSAEEIHNQIRGLNPWPSATSRYKDKGIKIHASNVIRGKGNPGEIFNYKGKLCVYCGDNALELTEVQLENGKRMSGEAFLLGHPIKETIILG